MSGELGSFLGPGREEGGGLFLTVCIQLRGFNDCLQQLEPSYASVPPLCLASGSEDTASSTGGPAGIKGIITPPFLFTHDKVGGRYEGGIL